MGNSITDNLICNKIKNKRFSIKLNKTDNLVSEK
jgi:hypothetical protein